MASQPNNRETSHLERDFRWQRLYKLMDEHDIDALLVFGSTQHGLAADRYLTNDRPAQHIIFPRYGTMTSLAFSTQVVAQNLISRERGDDTWLEDIRVGWTGVTIPDILREKGLDNKRVGTVGVDSSRSYPLARDGWVPYQLWARIKEALPNVVFQDMTHEYVMLMLEHSERDIANLRRAATAGEEACKVVLDIARAGATELDVYTAAMSSLLKSGMHATWMIMTSGHDNFSWGEPMWLFRAQPPRVLEEGDILMTEMFPIYGGMEAQLQLAIAIGEVHADHEICAKAARKAYEAGLSAIKPGATFGQVCDAMEEPVREIGGWHITPMIHTLNPLSQTGSIALGIEKHIPEIAQQYINVRGRERPTDDFELKPGMCLEFEPCAHLGRHRVNIGGTVLVTEDGAEELHDLPTRMQRVPA